MSDTTKHAANLTDILEINDIMKFIESCVKLNCSFCPSCADSKPFVPLSKFRTAVTNQKKIKKNLLPALEQRMK